jgi:guanosine-3',5'-bis(diphosphate) 3'-pyrophosphohydrolase
MSASTTKPCKRRCLHDVIEDTHYDKEQISSRFGPEVADLVDGVSKLTQIQFNSEAQAENFRKMVMAMTQDIRVILIKLADRTHNMRTLGSLRPDKRRRIARETLEIFAPIANRLGIHTMKNELEELGFEALYPMRSRVLRESVRRARGNRREIIDSIESEIEGRLREAGIDAQVSGREKNLFSIYNKMEKKELQFHEVMDIYAFRVRVKDIDTCYRVLGQMHSLYKPRPGRFKDYIAIPKSNGYQSLHTSPWWGRTGCRWRCRSAPSSWIIVAEVGIAAHWPLRTPTDDRSRPSR